MRATTGNCQYVSTTGKEGGERKWESAVGKRGYGKLKEKY
jgi:hypothetical protein